jgi:hypothetical protein
VLTAASLLSVLLSAEEEADLSPTSMERLEDREAVALALTALREREVRERLVRATPEEPGSAALMPTFQAAEVAALAQQDRRRLLLEQEMAESVSSPRSQEPLPTMPEAAVEEATTLRSVAQEVSAVVATGIASRRNRVLLAWTV